MWKKFLDSLPLWLSCLALYNRFLIFLVPMLSVCFVCVDVLGNFEWLVQLEISLISVSTLVFGTFKVLCFCEFVCPGFMEFLQVLVLVDHLVRALLHCVIV